MSKTRHNIIINTFVMFSKGSEGSSTEIPQVVIGIFFTLKNPLEHNEKNNGVKIVYNFSSTTADDYSAYFIGKI